MIAYDKLHELFEYKDGNLYRKKTTSTNAKKGQLVGTKCDGRLKITINKIPYKLHRIIYFMHYGYLPKTIDHIDGNPFNNKIENLRAATYQENNRNQKLKPNNTSGYKNVTYHARLKKWQVALTIDKKCKYFGVYQDIELADLVAMEARDKYFGKFARHF